MCSGHIPLSPRKGSEEDVHTPSLPLRSYPVLLPHSGAGMVFRLVHLLCRLPWMLGCIVVGSVGGTPPRLAVLALLTAFPSHVSAHRGQ